MGGGLFFLGSRGSLKSFPTDSKPVLLIESITELRSFEPYANARECQDDMIASGCRAPLANAEWPVESISANSTTCSCDLITRHGEVLWFGLSGNARTQI